MKSRRARSAPRSRGGCQYRSARSRPTDGRPASPDQFLACPWTHSGMPSSAQGDTVSEPATSRRSPLESEYSAEFPVEHPTGGPEGVGDGLGGLDWVDCPECGLPAYVLDRFVRPS